MLDYKALIQKVIDSGDYSLADIESRIDRLWIEGKLSDDDRMALKAAAASNADEAAQIDLAADIADLKRRVYDLEHPTDQYAIWVSGYQTQQHEVVRYDVTGDGEYDLCRYDGGRAWTGLGIGKIEGWHMVDRELNNTHTITRDADGGYVLTPIEGE